MKLETKIYNQINQLINGTALTKDELKNKFTVINYLESVKANEAADWVRWNHVLFLIGLLEGFEIDNSQASQLKNIHNNN